MRPDKFELFRVVQKRTSPAYTYDIGKDGTVWLMSPDFQSRMWRCMDDFLLGGDDEERMSLFDFAQMIDFRRKRGCITLGLDEFVASNRWMVPLAGCGSLEELALKMSVS